MEGCNYEARTKDGIMVTLDTFNESELTRELKKQVDSIPETLAKDAVAAFTKVDNREYYKLNEGELVDVTGLITFF